MLIKIHKVAALIASIFYLGNLTFLEAKDTVIFNLVHGTWAKKSPWYKQGGNFYTTLYRAAKKSSLPQPFSINSFEWSGKLSHDSRVKAGKKSCQSH